MADPLKERTEQLLTDYLEYCARLPGSSGRPPSTPEAALLRSLAAHIQRQYPNFFSTYLDYQGNRVEQLVLMAEAVFSEGGGLSWGRVVTLVTFAGTLLERRTQAATTQKKQAEVARDCRRLVGLLCSWLAVRHRAWLEAQGGWDGFCLFFRTPLSLNFWRRLLIQTLLTCFLTMALIFFWTRFYHKF